ncbi:MAG TPA: ABC transporter substrate-binding protein [Solirubrobacteraceae bacterium]|nr:ABC transporter substrate-binding protein [Solirubrobacteraceae bacterium]
MPGSLRGLICLSLASVAVSGLTACGGDDGDDDAVSDATNGGRTGGTITTAYTSFPDYLDPALSYTQEGWQSMWTVYTPLLTYKHEEGAEGATVVPGLAEAMPDISDDGRVYKLRLREGLTYSDGTDVKASDFEHTIKRVLNLQSGGSSFYQSIEGAERYIDDGRASADISGIETSDETGDITITLTEPDGRFPYILAMNFAAVVPGDTPFENQTKNPPPGVGPYKFDNVRINRGYDLVKVPAFDVRDQATGKLDTITVEVVKNRRRQTQDTIQNKIDYMHDPPAPDQLRDVRARYTGTRYEEFVTNSTYYYFLNHDVAPFDNAEAREAVNIAIDKRSLARLFGGLLEPGCNFLPPGMKGYEKVDPCPWGDPTAAPDVAKARQLVESSGTAGQAVTVFGNDEPEPRALAEYLSDVLNDIGYKARPRIIEASVYPTTIGNRKTRAQAGFASWFQDFPHPGNFMFLVDGDSIQPTNNQNFGNVNDPEINEILDAASRNADIEEVADEYARADRLTVEGAHVAAYGHRELTLFYSDRIDFENCTSWHPVYNLDLTQLCLK